MTEMELSILAGAKLFVVALIGLLYTLAGRGVKVPILGKIRRKVWLPLILCASLLISGLLKGVMTWTLLGAIVLTFPLAYGIYSAFAYGSGSWVRKVFTRIPQQFIVGAMHGLSLSILPCIVLGQWGVLAGAIIIPSVALGVYGGVFDKDIEAAGKEALTGALEFIVPMFIV